MTRLFGKIFGERQFAAAPPPMRGDIAYAAAMSRSDEIQKMFDSRSDDPAVAVMADIWAQKRNVPFLTTVIETVQELKAPIAQRADDRSTPKSSE